MTTYTFHGIFYSFDDNDDVDVFRYADMQLAVAPGVTGISYFYEQPDANPGTAPSTIDLVDGDTQVYSLLFDYFTNYDPSVRDALLIELDWTDAGGTTRTSYVLTVDITTVDGGEYAFWLAGDPLPTLDSAADFAAFNDSITGVRDAPVGSGFGVGETIDLTTLANVSVSENDRIQGTSGDDSFFGGNGDDTIETFEGDDYINPGDNLNYDSVRPGSGNDTVDFADLSVGYVDLHHWDLGAGITVNIDGNANTGSIDKGANGTTTLLDVVNPILAGWEIGGLGVLGTQYTDTFNITSADGGWMLLNGNGGADSYNIGASAGSLRVDFRYAPGGLSADFSTGQIFDDGWGNAETITGAENATEFRGTDNDDSIRGTDADERIILRQGNDTADAAGGFDLLRYDRSGAGAVTVDLLAGTATGSWNGEAFSHQVSNFEGVRGSRGNADSLSGTHGDNVLEGRGGDDTLVGLGGNDSLYGGDDDNTLFGNAGDDYLVVYEGDSFIDGGNDYDDGEVRDDSSEAMQITFGSTITARGMSGTGAGASTYYTVQMVNVERVVNRFSGDLMVQGDGDRNVLKLAYGPDYMEFDGGGGTDQLQLHQILRTDGSEGYSRAEFFTYYELVGTADDLSVRELDSGETRAVMTDVEEVRFTDGTFTSAELVGGGGSSGATSGDDTLFGTAGNDLIDALAGNDRVEGDIGFDTLIGGAGEDSLYGQNGFDSLDGGDGNDVLSGGNGNDTLNAGTGTAESQTWGDYVEPGAGADVIIGHADLFTQYNDGIDISWRDVTGSGGITLTVGADGSGTAVSANAGVVNDSFTYAHRFDGTAAGDSFAGSDNANWEGWGGFGGNDTMDGGGGYDELLYHHDYQDGGTGAVTVNFATGTATDGFGNTDTFSNMEAVRGSAQGDMLTGSAAISFISYRGLDGADTITGSASWDRADYSSDAGYGGGAGITANLGAGTITDGFGATDTVSMIDQVRGTDMADVINGSDGDEVLDGQGGNDTLGGMLGHDELRGGDGNDELYGGGGDDTLNGGAGDDSIMGGAGNDEVIGLGGSDTLDGGTGWNLLRYDQTGAGAVNIDFGAGTATGTHDGVAFTHQIANFGQSWTSNFNDVLTGDSGDNQFDANAGADLFSGLGGDDLFLGRSGNDTGYGGQGNDQLEGWEGSDQLFGGDGNDTLAGGSGNDTLQGGAGFDIASYALETDVTQGVTVNLLAGAATDGSGGIDSLAGIEAAIGTGMDDDLTGDGVDNYLGGGAGADTLRGYGANDVLEGETGADLIEGGAGNDTLTGGAGADTLSGGNGFDSLLAGDGDDLVNAGSQGDHVAGGNGSDSLYGNDGFDTLNGETGADEIAGHKGNDLIYGGDGHDTLYGNNGDDTVWGGNGQDMAWLGAGNDVFEDNTQEAPLNNDTVRAEGGDDSIYGGNGFDVFYGGAGSDYIRGGKGFDTIYGGDQGDTLDGNDGNDLVYGGRGADFAVLGTGADTWMDDAQTDFGDDQVFGGGGWDTIQSLGGDDTLTGGAGNDSFVFGDAMGDVFLADYEVGGDGLTFTAALWGDPLTQGQLDARASTPAGDLVLSLDTGATLTFDGVTSTAGLLGDIVLV